MPASRRPSTPCALSIAGFDPSGGAGIVADLRAFEAAGVWGCAVVAVLTVQSTRGLRKSVAVDVRLLTEQAAEVLSGERVRAIKIGALGSEANVRAVTQLVARLAASAAPVAGAGRAPRSRAATVPIVLDPVFAATRVAPATRPRLLVPSGIDALRALAARVTLVTPNADEAAVLLGRRVRNLVEAADAARELVRHGARAALVKGGHLGGAESIDTLFIGGRLFELAAPRSKRAHVHGTGCLLSSLISGRLAVAAYRKNGAPVSDRDIVAAVRWAKQRLTGAIDRAVTIGSGARVISPEGLRRG